MKRLELSGQRFGRLIVIQYSHTTNQGTYWVYEYFMNKKNNK